MGRKHSFQVSMDVINLGNLLNPYWGLKYSGRRNIIDFVKFDDTTGIPWYKLNSAYNSKYLNASNIPNW